jgi:hypothetical protein
MTSFHSVLARAALVALPLALAVGAPAAAHASTPTVTQGGTDRAAVASASADLSALRLGTRDGGARRCDPSTHDAAPCLTSTPPAGAVGWPYSFALTFDRGSFAEDAQIDVRNVELPPGLMFIPQTDTIVGTPVAAGSYWVWVTITDADHYVDTRVEIPIAERTNRVSCPTSTRGRVGASLTATCSTNSVPGAGTWSLDPSSAPMPAGLRLVGDTVSGVPATAGEHTILLRYSTASSSTIVPLTLSVARAIVGTY